MNKNFLIIAAAIGAYFLIKSKSGTASGGGGNTEAMKQALINYSAQFTSYVNLFSASELQAVYTYITQYVASGTKPPIGSELSSQIQAISSKYNIFT